MALLRQELESGSSGQMRRASSGYWRSAALHVCEEDGGLTNCVYHVNEVLEPVLPGSMQRGSKVQHVIRENFPFTTDHVSELLD